MDDRAGEHGEHGARSSCTWYEVSFTTAFFFFFFFTICADLGPSLPTERTFLAWLRTSLGFASIGIAITQLFRLNTSLASGQGDDPHLATIRHIGKPLGATFIGISILVLLLGYMRYYQSQQWVMKGKFPASRGAIILVSLISFALMAVSLTVVIVVQPTTVRAQ